MKNSNTFYKVIIICLMVFSSCSKDETSEIQPETQPEAHQNLLLKITDSDGLTSTYSYDSNNRLDNYKRNGNDFNPDLNQNLVYNADGTLQKLVQADNGAIVTEFFYDANKKIIKKIGRSGFDTFKYSYSGNVITEDYRSATTDVGWRQTYTYDENGNIIELKSYNDATDANPEGTFSAVINYTYDDKKNAASSFPQGFLFPSSANNIKTAQYNGGGIGSSQYEYNLDGYPTKRTDSFTRVYEYKRL